jgi:hypothetical protein
MSYEIETRGRYRDEWTNDIGYDNEFASEADAREMIEELKTLGEDWAAAEYRVRGVAVGASLTGDDVSKWLGIDGDDPGFLRDVIAEMITGDYSVDQARSDYLVVMRRVIA